VIKKSIRSSFACEELSTRKSQSLIPEEMQEREDMFKVSTAWLVGRG